MQKSMDKMVSKIKSLEKKVSGSSSKKKKSRPPHSLGVDLSSPLQGGSLPKSLTFLSSQGKEKTTRREGGRVPRPDAPARPPDSIESKQRKLNSIELRVDGPLWTVRASQLHQGQGSHTHFNEEEEEEEPQARSSEPEPRVERPDGRLPLQTTTLPPSSLGGTEAKFGGANSSSIELGVKTRKVVFWSILEHMGREEHGRTWCMDAAQLDTQRKKEEAILKTSSTLPRLLDRPSFNSIELRSQSQTRKMLLPP
ncbi:unnamed protein product [Microthlaspi erraticum]|uniref:Uncharacterized protein n=1 Tax=Microthlaspi erraticum TaxID=1685480 RepID=A0A6D2IY17_9BRAS|nr:unnamed protein product [Microthlaspi erraticum]